MDASESGVLVEDEQRFSQSILWKLQRQFYEVRGPTAWSSGAVPSYVTSNPYIAQVYAHVVLAYLRDAMPTLDPKQPIYIVELAAGSGRFSYLFLKTFHALKSASSLRALDCRYVMTDFTLSNVRAWAAQPLYRSFLDAGLLHFGLFDMERDREIALISGETLSAATVRNPIIAIANYAFDTLVQDQFRVENGKLHEVRMSLRSRHGHPPDLGRPEIMSELVSRFTLREIGTDYYGDRELDAILATYCGRLAETTFTVPVGALTAVRHLAEIAGGRLLVLSSDKGMTHEDELHGIGQQPIEFHGSLSMMVNYHALGLFFTGRGGLYASTSPRDGGLRTAALLLGGEAERFADTILSFRERADVFGPYDVFTLVGRLRKDVQAISAEQFLCLLRLTHFDPYIVHQFGRDAVNAVQGASDVLQMELRLALDRVWDNYFPVGNDLGFEMGRLFMALKRPREGIRVNQHSIDHFGENAGTYANQGICYYQAEEPDEAIRCFDRAIALKPDFAAALAWRTRVIAERERIAEAPAVTR